MLDTSRHLRHFSHCCHESRFLVCFSFWLFNIVVHYPTYVKKLKEVQMLLFQTSREIIFYFQHFIQVCFYSLGKKTGRGGPPLATALRPPAYGPKLQSWSKVLRHIFVNIWSFCPPPPPHPQHNVDVDSSKVDSLF